MGHVKISEGIKISYHKRKTDTLNFTKITPSDLQKHQEAEYISEELLSRTYKEVLDTLHRRHTNDKYMGKWSTLLLVIRDVLIKTTIKF